MKPVFIAAIAGTVLLAGGVLGASEFNSTGGATIVAQNAPVNQAGQMQTAQLKTATLKVGNMYCASCPIMVKRTLERVAGVSGASVSYKSKIATVTYDPAQCDAAKLAATVSEMGYPATVVQ